MTQRSVPIVAFAALSALALAPALRAQKPAPAVADSGSLVARAILDWIGDYESGRLAPKATLQAGRDLQPRYVQGMRAAGLVHEGDEGRVTHLDMLGKLLFYAEKNPSDALADAVLGVAAVGLSGSLVDLDTSELRELGMWTLLRFENEGAWFVVMRAAAGERTPLLDGFLPPEQGKVGGVTEGPARRVAALQALGRKNLPVARGTLQSALVDEDPRVRLAAAEGLVPPWSLATVQAVADALADERHPVVSQAQVKLLLAMLRTPPAELAAEAKALMVVGALQQLGRCGWRTDMELLDLVEAFPHKDAIPPLLGLLERAVKHPDALVGAVNKRASPLLRERTGDLLRAMTGALLPQDDPAQWQEFWQREQERIVVPATLKKPDLQRTRGTFFGVPVTGSSIGFLIDNSGSMEGAPSAPAETGKKQKKALTRLQAAKEQMLLAVQSMPRESQFHVFTFSSAAKQWTPQPVPADQRSVRVLTELLSRIQPDGSTNLHDGLQLALQWQDARYGEAPKAVIDELFVLSDGEPTAGPVRDAEQLLAMVKQVNQYARVRIHCVFTGLGDGGELLKKLAEQNDGVFVQR